MTPSQITAHIKAAIKAGVQISSVTICGESITIVAASEYVHKKAAVADDDWLDGLGMAANDNGRVNDNSHKRAKAIR